MAVFGPEWQLWNYSALMIGVLGLIWTWWPELSGWFTSDGEKTEAPSVKPKMLDGKEKIVEFFEHIRLVGEDIYFSYRPEPYGFMYRRVNWGEDDLAYKIRPIFRALLLPFWIVGRSIYILFLVFLFIIPFAVMVLVIDAVFGMGLLDISVTL